MYKCMANDGPSRFNFRLDHFGGTDCLQMFCFRSTVGATKNDGIRIDCPKALNGEFRRINLWKRHDKDRGAICSSFQQQLLVRRIPIE